MPIGIGAGAAIAGIAGAGAAVTAGVINSKAAGSAADSASASNAASLAFQKQQAENDYKNQETTRKANYDQYVAKQTAMNQVRQGLGLRPVEIPPYVPSVDPQFGSTPPGPTGTTGPAGPMADPTHAATAGAQPTAQQKAQQYFRDQAGPQSNIAPGLSLGQMAQPGGFLPTQQPLVDAQGNPIQQSPFTLKYPIQT